jgi:exodeoxyribonuclease VII large subunit
MINDDIVLDYEYKEPVKTKKINHTVTQIAELIKKTLKKEFNDAINIEGEVSNVKIKDGNLYLTLKDNSSSISVMYWSYEHYSNVQVTEGDKVIITGKITFYTKSANCNVLATKITHLGIGDIHAQYQLAKDKFQKNGYFDEDHKILQPDKINNIGIATSSEGAALQDILYVFKQNNFKGNVIVKNCIVQGQKCADSVVQAIDYLEKYTLSNGEHLDVILISRGGGSFEDLMGFSHELIIKRIYKCKIFTISAIGHEIDFMLSDFVASMRAPTPSIAANLLSTHWANINAILINGQRTKQMVKSQIDHIIDDHKRQFNDIKKNVNNLITTKIIYFKNSLDKIKLELNNYNFDDIMKKGFCLLHLENGDIISNIDSIVENQKLCIKLINGEINVTINSITKC